MFAAGAPSQTFSAFANIGSVTWTMIPTVGTLTSGGLYTPPSSETEPTATTVTATSTTNSAVAASMTVVILPNVNSIVRLAPAQTMDYTDASSNAWYAGPLNGGDATCDASLSCYGQSNGGSWPMTPDIALYEASEYAVNDLRFDIFVPNGTYAITAKFANNDPTSTDIGNFLIETQGVSQTSPTDVYTLVGTNEPYDYSTTVNVSTGELSFVLRSVNTIGLKSAPFISALSASQLSNYGAQTTSGAAIIGGAVVR